MTTQMYPCPECGHITEVDEEAGVTRRQIDCSNCEAERTVDALTEAQRRQLDALENVFTYHAPKPGQPEKYRLLRENAKALAALIIINTPQSREQSLALTNLEQSIFWANAAVARHS